MRSIDLMAKKRMSVRTRTKTIVKRARKGANTAKNFIKGTFAGIGASEIVDIIGDEVGLNPIIETPIAVGAGIGIGYVAGGKWGAVGGGVGSIAVEAYRFFRTGGGNSGFGGEVGL